MSFLDRIKDGITSIVPARKPTLRTSMSGIGHNSGHGMVPFDDDMIVPKRTIIFHAAQIFFNFLAMACFASVAAFQAKWKIGPSGLSGFAIFISIVGMLLSAFMLLVPVAYEKYDKLVRLARALKEVRVGFILNGLGTGGSLLISFIVTISVFTQPGCKNVANDPHAEELGEDFQKELPNWCNTKKAAAVFFWLVFVFWLVSVVFLVLDWRSGKLHAPRDPPFAHPSEPTELDEADDDEESTYHHVEPVRRPTVPTTNDSNTNADSPFADAYRYSSASNNTQSQSALPPHASTFVAPSRPSIDAYGAFSDPAPSGFGTNSYVSSNNSIPPPTSHYVPSHAPQLPEPDMGPRVSRTMQYAGDPYAAVRASIAGPSGPASTPPGYDSYGGYTSR